MKLECNNCAKKITRAAKAIDIYAIRADYEKGMNTLELSIKYKISKVRAAESIRQAGGTMRSRGSKKWQ